MSVPRFSYYECFKAVYNRKINSIKFRKLRELLTTFEMTIIVNFEITYWKIFHNVNENHKNQSFKFQINVYLLK